MKRAIIPAGAGENAARARMSAGIRAGGFVFLTGVTGVGVDGVMPDDPATQFRNAFEKIGGFLRADGLYLDAIVEMTSYHIGLRAHFDLFDSLRQHYLSEPWPAWTAVEVAGLRREGAIVEIRIIAHAPDV